jgi:hypothetical protein
MCGSLVLAGIAGSFRPTDAAAAPNRMGHGSATGRTDQTGLTMLRLICAYYTNPWKE